MRSVIDRLLKKPLHLHIEKLNDIETRLGNIETKVEMISEIKTNVGEDRLKRIVDSVLDRKDLIRRLDEITNHITGVKPKK